MELLKKYKNAPNDQQNICTQLKDNQQYVERLTTLERLTSDLQQHKAQRDQLKQLSGRLSSDARQFVSREAAALPMLTADAFDALAKKAGAANSDDLLNEIADVRRRAKETQQLSHPNLGQYGDERDLDHIENLDNERAAVMLLERAVELQRNDVLRVKNIAMAEIMVNLKPRHETISRRISSALIGLARALEEERRFIQELTSQDSSFADSLNLKPLSRAEILASPAVTLWVAEAVRNGIIDQKDAYDLAPAGGTA